MGRMKVYVATRNPVKLRAVRDALTERLGAGGVDVRPVDPPASLPEQPLGEEVSCGAIARAKVAIEPSDAEWGVGIEAGLIQLPGSERWLSVQVCAIVDRRGKVSVGLGPGHELPEALCAAVLAGAPLREALRLTFSIDDAENRGAIHVLSDGRFGRYEITLDAVRMALLSSEHR
jgi:inosine/xanthosine triphosphatase